MPTGVEALLIDAPSNVDDQCGASCADECHGTKDSQLRCIRGSHPHGTDEASPHVGRDAHGQLVQWICVESEVNSVDGKSGRAEKRR